MQVKLLGMRVEEWLKSQTLHMKEVQDNVEKVNDRMIDIEALMGEMLPGIAEIWYKSLGYYNIFGKAARSH